MEEKNKGQSAVWVTVVVFFVAIASYIVFQFTKGTPTTPVNSADNTASTPTPAPTPVLIPTVSVPKMMSPNGGMMSSYAYKNGTYSVTGNYFSPGGDEQIAVQVTLQNDVITSANVQGNNPSGGTAARYQSIFISNFKQYVIGKKIDQVQLDKVSGSSLTPMGWNDAITKIEQQAKA